MNVSNNKVGTWRTVLSVENLHTVAGNQSGLSQFLDTHLLPHMMQLISVTGVLLHSCY